MIRNQSGQVVGAQILDSTTGAAFVGAVTVFVTGDNNSQAIGSVGSGLCASEGGGYYTYNPSAAETNYALAAFTFVGVGAVPKTVAELITPFERGQSGRVIGAQLVDASTGLAFSGAVTASVTGDGGTQTTGGSCTAKGNGYYTYLPSSTETDFALIAFTFTGSGAIPETVQVAPVTADLSDDAVSAQTIITGALELIGVLAEGETPTYAQSQQGLRRLNMMLRGWSLQPRTFLVTEREVFDLVAGKGSTSDPYTIGPGGDLDTERPMAITRAATLLTSSTPSVESPIAVYDSNQYQSIVTKGLSNGMAAGVYLQLTAPLAKLYVWPVLDSATNDLVLYLKKPLASFANLTTTYDLPDGAEEAIEYNLAVRLCGPFTIPIDPDIKAIARSSLSNLKRSTYELVDLASPFAAGGQYDIYSDTIQ